MESSFDPTVFTKNRNRLLEHDVAREFFMAIVAHAKQEGLMSYEHFTVDGTLIEAWASMKSFRPKDEKPSDRSPPDDRGNPTVDFHGEKRSNETHQSTTDPDARLYKKSAGSEARLAYLGHLLTENRHGLVVKTAVTRATGTAERDAALRMIKTKAGARRITVGGDKNFDTREFVEKLRKMGVTPHVAQNTQRRGGSAIDQRTTRHAGYAVSQQKRKRIEQSFGWMKIIGLLKKVKLRGREKVGWLFTFVDAAYNLYRLSRLPAEDSA